MDWSSPMLGSLTPTHVLTDDRKGLQVGGMDYEVITPDSPAWIEWADEPSTGRTEPITIPGGARLTVTDDDPSA